MVDATPDTSTLVDTPRVTRQVILPVFLKVSLPADDDLEAEAAAVEVVRSMAALSYGEASVEFQSVLAPSCKPL